LKKLKVPEQNLQQESLLNQMELLKSNGAIALIDEINWKIDFPKYLPVSIHVAHDNNYLFLLYHVKGEILRTVK